MRKILILFYFFIINSSNVHANTINEQLNKLFDDLKINNSKIFFRNRTKNLETLEYSPK